MDAIHTDHDTDSRKVTKKTPKQSDFFLSYDSSGKRIRNSKHKYRSVAERKRNKKDATCGQTMCAVSDSSGRRSVFTRQITNLANLRI